MKVEFDIETKGNLKKIDKKILEKFVDSKCSESEKQIVVSWFIDNQFDTSLKEAIKKHYYEFLETEESGLNEYEIRELLDKVHHKINLRQFNKKNNNYYRRFIDVYSKIAAVLLIPLIVASVLFSIKYTQQSETGMVKVVAPFAARIQFTLPDGSSGWLNSGSELKYQAGMQDRKRRVYLIGEAFFQVKKDKSRPFIVKSDKIEVKVLGTKFNVNAYPEDKNIEVTLQRGKVEVYGITDSNVKTPVVQLSPGEQVSISKSDISQMKKRKVSNVEYFTGWIDDLLVFRGDQMDDVARKLSRWFNVDITLQDEELKDYKLHATFHNESLDEILKLIKLTSPIDYKITKRIKKQDGTYSKESIVFVKKK